MPIPNIPQPEILPQTVKKVCKALVLGKEDSLKETHEGCLSAI